MIVIISIMRRKWKKWYCLFVTLTLTCLYETWELLNKKCCQNCVTSPEDQSLVIANFFNNVFEIRNVMISYIPYRRITSKTLSSFIISGTQPNYHMGYCSRLECSQQAARFMNRKIVYKRPSPYRFVRFTSLITDNCFELAPKMVPLSKIRVWH